MPSRKTSQPPNKGRLAYLLEAACDHPFRKHFIDLVLPSIGLALREYENGESKVSTPLVEGLQF